jgi:hypothetical protein
MSWLRTTWHSVLDIIGEPVPTPVDNGDPATDRWSGTTSQRGIAMSTKPPLDAWVVQRITLSKKELWANEMVLKGSGRAVGMKLILTGMWLSKFPPPMFLNSKVKLVDMEQYIQVQYVDYPILKADSWTTESASG